MRRLMGLCLWVGFALLASAAFAAAFGTEAGSQVLPPGVDGDCAGQTPIVVASDEAAQSDLYSAAMLAGVLDTTCIVLAGERDEPMDETQLARLDAAEDAGWVMGGEAAVPSTKVARRHLKRLNGVDRWHTARLTGAVAADPDGDVAVLANLTAPVAGAGRGTSVMVDGVEVRLPPGIDSDCAGQVPIVVATDAAAQSDLYSAVTLAGVLDTSCIVLAGARGAAITLAQQERLFAAQSPGWIVGGEDAVPSPKVAGYNLDRQGGPDRWQTARLIGAVATSQATGTDDAGSSEGVTTTTRAERRTSSGGGGGTSRRVNSGGGTSRTPSRTPSVTSLPPASPRTTSSVPPSRTVTNWSVPASSTSTSGLHLPPNAFSDCVGQVPIVVASDVAAQSDLYSAATLAGVLDTTCVVLAGPRDESMHAVQVARLDAAEPTGWVMGGEAAVPAVKVEGRSLKRLNGVDDWHTARLTGAIAVDPGGDIAELTEATAPAQDQVGREPIFVDGAEVRLPPGLTDSCEGQLPIVVASDAAAQADLYSAATLAGALDTTCIVLAGARGEAMPATQLARLWEAELEGWIVGGEAAVPSLKVAGFGLTRVGGANIWETARLIGATAVVQAARDRGVPPIPSSKRSELLEASIAAAPGSSFVKISFSHAVSDAALDPANYTVAGSPLFEQDVICDSTSDRRAGMPCAAPGWLGPNEIAIVLNGYKLSEGDVIEIAGGRIMGVQFGGGRSDDRVLAATSFRVPALIDDRREPGVSVLAPAGANFVRVVVEEENTIVDALSEDEVWITVGNTVYTGDAAATRTDADGNAYTSQRLWVFPAADNKRFDIGWNCADGADFDTDVDGDIGVTGLISECDQANLLAVGNTVEIVEGAIADGSGNASPRRRSLVVEVVATNDYFATQGWATLTIPAVHVETVDGAAQPQNVEIEIVQQFVDGTESVAFKLTARSYGPNAGAAGNGWRFGMHRVADEDDDVSPVGIDINERRRSIGVTYDDEITLFGLARALQTNVTIAASFEVVAEGTWPDAAYTDAIAATTTLFPRSGGNNPAPEFPTEIVTAGGRTAVKLELTFTEVIKSFDVDTFANGNFGSSFGPRAVAGGNVWTGVQKSPTDGPTRTVTLTYIYDNQANVPFSRQTVNVPAGTATNYGNVGNLADLGIRVAEAR